MSLRPYRNKRDTSEQSIVDTLRKAGCTVHLIDRPVDALLYFRERTHIAEFKSGKGKLTPAQLKFMREWPGPVWVLRTPAEAVAWINGAGK